jgi:DNA-binding response OmpR family regulator
MPCKHHEHDSATLLHKRILVVDDDPSVREMLARVLTVEGYQAFPARDGNEALGIVSKQRIDLVLLDLNLPGQDGWEILSNLTVRQPTLPVIIVTARANQVFTALSAGVGALHEKPLNFHSLLQSISRILSESVEERLDRISGKRAHPALQD